MEKMDKGEMWTMKVRWNEKGQAVPGRTISMGEEAFEIICSSPFILGA